MDARQKYSFAPERHVIEGTIDATHDVAQQSIDYQEKPPVGHGGLVHNHNGCLAKNLGTRVAGEPKKNGLETQMLFGMLDSLGHPDPVPTIPSQKQPGSARSSCMGIGDVVFSSSCRGTLKRECAVVPPTSSNAAIPVIAVATPARIILHIIVQTNECHAHRVDGY